MRDLVRVIGMERANYSDAITSFLEDLHTRAHFEDAQVPSSRISPDISYRHLPRHLISPTSPSDLALISP